MDIKKIYNKIKPKNRKEKNIFALIVLLILICIGALIYTAKSKTSTIEQDYHIEDTSSIFKIEMKDKLGNSLILEKQNDSLWTVNKDFECNKISINNLLETLGNMRIREEVPNSAVDNLVKSLASSSVQADVYTEDYLINMFGIKLFKRKHLSSTFYVGTETQDRMGTYMLKKGDKHPKVMYIPVFRGYISSRFNAMPDLWKSHNVFRYKQSEIKKLTVNIPNQQTQSFALVNNGEGFDFLDYQGNQINNFDTSKVVALLSSFVNMNYESIAHDIDKEQQDTIFTHNPIYIITIDDKKGKQEKMSLYFKPGDDEIELMGNSSQNFVVSMADINRCYALTSKTKDTLIMQYFVLDNVLQPASYFIHK
ncbi:MAG: DUF4340 domain-containing protein [Bacteroidales bacterium]|nr:DUF4340 domain-containing protein [Bacteroidales bacterium]